MDDTEELKSNLLKNITTTDSLKELENIRVHSLGKKGSISLLMKQLGNLEPSKRKDAGRSLNILQSEILSAIENQKNLLESVGLEKRLQNEKVDITLTPRPENTGRIHPIV